MDLITIIWYFSTFLLLILFFIVMVCSDNVCNRRRQNKPEDIAITAPPTPAPSYREFAPPGYDTVMKKYKNRIHILPNSNEPGIFSQMHPPPPQSPRSSSIASPILPRTTLSTVSEIVEFQVERERQQRNSSRADSHIYSPVIFERAEAINEVTVAAVEPARRWTRDTEVPVIIAESAKVSPVIKPEDDSRSVTG